MSETSQAPDEAALRQLEDYLGSADSPANTLSIHGVDGFLFALACSPDPPAPTQWLATVFGGEMPQLQDESRAEVILGTLLKLNSQVTEQVKAGTYALPEACEPRTPAVENLAADAPLQQWSHGFDLGHARTAELWDQLVPTEYSEELGTGLLALSFWADTDAIRELRERSAEASSVTVEELAERLVEILPAAVTTYATVGRSIANMLGQRQGTRAQTPVRSEKVGRNDPCPCGSGRKYKKCCGVG